MMYGIDMHGASLHRCILVDGYCFLLKLLGGGPHITHSLCKKRVSFIYIWGWNVSWLAYKLRWHEKAAYTERFRQDNPLEYLGSQQKKKVRWDETYWSFWWVPGVGVQLHTLWSGTLELSWWQMLFRSKAFFSYYFEICIVRNSTFLLLGLRVSENFYQQFLSELRRSVFPQSTHTCSSDKA
jgi:hypothetical protein